MERHYCLRFNTIKAALQDSDVKSKPGYHFFLFVNPFLRNKTQYNFTQGLFIQS